MLDTYFRFKCNTLHDSYKIVVADIEIAVEKKAFFINDYKHDTSMAGDWARKVSNNTKEISIPDYKDHRRVLLRISFILQNGSI